MNIWQPTVCTVLTPKFIVFVLVIAPPARDESWVETYLREEEN